MKLNGVLILKGIAHPKNIYTLSYLSKPVWLFFFFCGKQNKIFKKCLSGFFSKFYVSMPTQYWSAPASAAHAYVVLLTCTASANTESLQCKQHMRMTGKQRNCCFCFVFVHKKYSRCFIKLRLNHCSHMDYFNDVFTTFLGLESGN